MEVDSCLLQDLCEDRKSVFYGNSMDEKGVVRSLCYGQGGLDSVHERENVFESA